MSSSGTGLLVSKSRHHKKVHGYEFSGLSSGSQSNSSLLLASISEDESLTTNIHKVQLSDEMSCTLRLFEVKSCFNIANEAFQQTLLIYSSEEMRYRKNYATCQDFILNNKIGGKRYKELLSEGFFKNFSKFKIKLHDERDVTLTRFIDGYIKSFRKLMIMINANLFPEKRVKNENLNNCDYSGS
ncbi:hypothetical protein Glove_21g299 [Diversispora epigaea]|uniref:Uncharacterized protein n=1 Tax=Diversispora epigaea TaxID=1348612 RepID=A0A397JW71_9GLOM|nr:hypothetical protein Glove_21g299 [Diversispora epigaea]